LFLKSANDAMYNSFFRQDLPTIDVSPRELPMSY
jgi:hypothetical protein